MKRIFAPILIAFTFSVMFSSVSFAGWTKVAGNSAATFYVDFSTVKYRGRIIYYWELQDFTTRTPMGWLSARQYNMADCDLIAEKGLSWVWYGGPMGRGQVVNTNSDPDKNWKYRPPGTSAYAIIRRICKDR